MNRKALSVCAAAVAAVVASQLHAEEVQWRGGDGGLLDVNYTLDGVDIRPVANDFLNLGTGATITSAATSVPGRIRIGHNFNLFADGVTPSTLTGAATLNHSTGTLSLGGQTGGAYAGVRAGIVIGYNADGTLNVTGGIVSSTQNSVIGADNPDDVFTGTGTGTLNVSGTGTFRTLNNDMLIGHGNAGVVNLSDTGTINVLPTSTTQTADPDMFIGFRTASTYTQTGGTLRVANSLTIDNGSTATITGGQVFTKAKTIANGFSEDAPAGNIFVGRNGSDGDTLNIGGTAEVNVGNRFLLSSAGSGGATNAVVNQSGGTLNVALAFVVSDSGPTSTSTYNLSGGTLNTAAELSRIGRRGDGKMFQSGGSATFGAGLAVGEDANTAAGETDDATGLYEISGGSLVANLAGDALRIGSAGNGTFRVVGDDGIVDVNGNFLLGNTDDGVGNLEYRFEAGDLLSQIDVSGTATFASGSGLSLDSSLAAPTQTSYDLLTALDIIDNGLSLTTPGWSLQVVAGGNGEILRALQLSTLYWDTDGATAGSGGETPSGNWDGTAANFTTDAAGASAATTAVTSSADDVVFAAGSDANGAYTVTVSGTQAANSVQVARGNVTFAGGTIATDTLSVATGASASVGSAVSSTTGLTKNGAGTLTLTSANAYTGGTTVAEGTLVAANADAINTGQALTVNAGATLRSQSGVSTALDVSALTIAPTGRVDLNDGGLVKRNGGSGAAGQAATQQVTAALKTGLENGGNFDWLGAGISSTEANADNATAGSVLYGLGVVQNNLAAAGSTDGTTTDATVGNEIYTSFKGRTVALNDTLVKYTYMGDADLSGDVTSTDYSLIDSGFALNLGGWLNGDFDYSGAVDATDYALIDNAFAFQTGPLSVEFLARYEKSLAMFGQEYVAALAAVQSGVVPEPGTLGVLALAGMGLLARRRHRGSISSSRNLPQ